MMAENGDKILDLDESKISNKEAPSEGRFVSCDAMFSRLRTAVLIVKPADCVVSLLVAASNRGTVIGLIHTGFRGVDLDLPSKAIRHLTSVYGVNPADITIGITPHISAESYYIRSLAELRDPTKWQGFIEEKEGLYYLNTRGLLLQQYNCAGVSKDNIEVYDIDTYSAAKGNESYSERFWRLHQVSQNGRFVVAIAPGGSNMSVM